MILNSNYLKLPRLIILVWVIVLSLRSLPFGGAWEELTTLTWFAIIVWAIFYFSAMFLGLYHKPNNHFKTTDLNSLRNANLANYWIRRLGYLSIIGALLITYEFAFVRGYGFITPVTEIRISEVMASIAGSKSSWISGLGRMLTPALMVAWIIARLKWEELRKLTFIVLSIASTIVFYQQMMFEGGRFFFASIILMIYITSVFKKANMGRSERKVNKPRRRLIWGISILCIVFYFSQVFVDRFKRPDLDYYDSYKAWATSLGLTMSDGVQSRLTGEGAEIWLSAMMFWAYSTHGANILNKVLEADNVNRAWGLYQFPQVGQILGIIFDLDLKYDVYQNLEKAGTYPTIYGASYIDFGHIGAVVFLSFLGWFTGRSITKMLSGEFDGISISAPLFITMGVFSPIVSLATNLWPAFAWAILIGILTKLYLLQIDSKEAMLSGEREQLRPLTVVRGHNQ